MPSGGGKTKTKDLWKYIAAEEALRRAYLSGRKTDVSREEDVEERVAGREDIPEVKYMGEESYRQNILNLRVDQQELSRVCGQMSNMLSQFQVMPSQDLADNINALKYERDVIFKRAQAKTDEITGMRSNEAAIVGRMGAKMIHKGSEVEVKGPGPLEKAAEGVFYPFYVAPNKEVHKEYVERVTPPRAPTLGEASIDYATDVSRKDLEATRLQGVELDSRGKVVPTEVKNEAGSIMQNLRIAGTSGDSATTAKESKRLGDFLKQHNLTLDQIGDILPIEEGVRDASQPDVPKLKVEDVKDAAVSAPEDSKVSTQGHTVSQAKQVRDYVKKQQITDQVAPAEEAVAAEEETQARLRQEYDIALRRTEELITLMRTNPNVGEAKEMRAAIREITEANKLSDVDKKDIVLAATTIAQTEGIDNPTAPMIRRDVGTVVSMVRDLREDGVRVSPVEVVDAAKQMVMSEGHSAEYISEVFRNHGDELKNRVKSTHPYAELYMKESLAYPDRKKTSKPVDLLQDFEELDKAA